MSAARRLARRILSRLSSRQRRRKRDAWERLADCLRILTALDDGSMPWRERYDEADLPPGPCKQSAAIELAERDAVEARLELLAGAR